MKEHQRTDRLTVITILLVLLVAIVVLSYRAPRLKYEKAPEAVLAELTDPQYGLGIGETEELIKNGNAVLVDLRNADDFFVQHIDGAINVPAIKILDEEYIDLFEEKETQYILYGNRHIDANGPWLLLKQLGFDNIRILVGGFQNYLNRDMAFPSFFANMQEIEMATKGINDEISKAALRFMEEDESISGEKSESALNINKEPVTPRKIMPVIQKTEAADEGC